MMTWPEPGTLSKVAAADIPTGSRVWGMAPIGIRWTARKTKTGIQPDGDCPRSEFSPCYADVRGTLMEVA